MGVDATLMVIGHGADDEGYCTTAFRLDRDRDLWPSMEALPKRHLFEHVVVPQGPWCNYAGDVPEGYEERECGYIQKDAYGNTLHACKGRDFESVESDFSDFNNAVLAFVIEHYANHYIVIFWH